MLERSDLPRIAVAALKGGAGKTFLTLGLVGAMRKRGLSVAVFKKGPDYIDAGWLGLAAGGECCNLDAYLFDRETVRASFFERSVGADVAVVEGNRGLFDGVDAEGSYSTAELAKMLKLPVILIVDATKVTRTVAAMVLGCRVLDPDLDLRAVILNRVGGARHESVLRDSIEECCSIPVIGAVKKLSPESFPQRHLGLLPLYEHPRALEFVADATQVVEQSVDMDRLMDLATSAGPLDAPASAEVPTIRSEAQTGLRIGVLRDSAFQFYYPENLEALRRGGAQLVEVTALLPAELPDLDALYIGGGFPETHAERLAENEIFKESLRTQVEAGLPVYAECGGLMYLSRDLRIDSKVFPMVGIFPVHTVLERKPQGHGYIEVEVTGPNPFYPTGTRITGHEFHYSYVTGLEGNEAAYAFRVLRGHGMDRERDGISTANVLGTYVHVHALGTPLWAEGILRKAREFRAERRMQGEKHPGTGDRLKAL